MRHAPLALAAILCLATTRAEAVPVTYSFEGAVRSTTGPSPYSIGQAFVAVLSYDTDAPFEHDPGGPPRLSAFASDAYPIGFGLYIGGDAYQRVATAFPGELFASDDDEGDDFFQAVVPGAAIDLIDSTLTAIDFSIIGPDELPIFYVPELAAGMFDSGFLRFQSGDWSISGTLDPASIAPVPEPSTVALAGIGLGLLGLGWMRRREG